MKQSLSDKEFNKKYPQNKKRTQIRKLFEDNNIEIYKNASNPGIVVDYGPKNTLCIYNTNHFYKKPLLKDIEKLFKSNHIKFEKTTWGAIGGYLGGSDFPIIIVI